MALRRIFKYTLAVIFVCSSLPQLNAQEKDAISIQETYPLIFKDFQRRELKKEITQFFEHNFVDLIADIENTATREELPALGKFLKAEFVQYADVLPLKQIDLEQQNKWIAFKQKEYQCMIVGRKIKNNEAAQDNIQEYASQLRSLLAQLLEVKLAKEQSDIDQLGKRLDHLKKVHQIRKNNKKKILQNRFDELVGDKALYQW